jgi:hypothetical protein
MGQSDPLNRVRQGLLLQEFAKGILETADQRRWTIQGLGMLRTYLGGGTRLHIWDDRFAVPDVSEMHNHPWNLFSFVCSGLIRNQRFEYSPSGQLYKRQMLFCGAGGGLKGEPEDTTLELTTDEFLFPGDSYEQRAEEIHQSKPIRGTVTIVHRTVPQGGSPDLASVFWGPGADWVSAEPKPAEDHEIAAIVSEALADWPDNSHWWEVEDDRVRSESPS